MVIGKINQGRREKLMVTLQESKGTRVVDCRVYDLLHDGELKATPAGVSLELDQVEVMIELLREAKKKAAQRG